MLTVPIAKPISVPALRPSESAIPTVHSGGTNATAIATPARAEETLGRVYANAAAAPAATAMPRSRRLGFIRATNSEPASFQPMISETKKAMVIITIVPDTTVNRERKTSTLFISIPPKAREIMGFISGATIMAPIITAALLDNKPNVAMIPEAAKHKEKSKSRYRALFNYLFYITNQNRFINQMTPGTKQTECFCTHTCLQ